MRSLNILCLALLALCGLEAGAAEPAKAAADPRSPDFMPRGLYWAGELVWRDAQNKIDWARVEPALDDLAKRSVNALWLTHLSPADTAEFARRAATRGIFLVASIADLAGDVEHIRKGDHRPLIERVLKSWGDAPKPIAWGLGDEPRTESMNEMAAYVAAWHKFAPNEPVTTVVMHHDLSAAGKAGFDALSADIYPFFSGGNPNSYNMPPFAAWSVNACRLAAMTPKSWMMGQSYQEPWGPFELDEKGNIVYLPGGAPHWVAPTPAQIRWQALSTFALACKGMFYFLYIWPTDGNPKAEPAKLPAAVKERTNSNAPRAMAYPDGRPTPQLEAMGEAFAWLANNAKVLAPLKASVFPEVWETQPAKIGGNVVSMLVDPKSKKRWLMIVASYDLPAGEPVRFTVGPHVIGLRDVAGGEAVKLAVAAPFRNGEIKPAPATAVLLECVVDEKNLPSGYADDFMTDKFQSDAVQVQSVKRHGDQVLSASGDEDAPNAFVVYDLQKWMPEVPEGGVRMLMYEGAANPPDFRGAFWSASPDKETWAKLTANEFGKQVFFKERYLKVGLCWKQTGAAYAYGCLSRFAVVQWPRPAKP